jgi:hypothetical protein
MLEIGTQQMTNKKVLANKWHTNEDKTNNSIYEGKKSTKWRRQNEWIPLSLFLSLSLLTKEAPNNKNPRIYFFLKL